MAGIPVASEEVQEYYIEAELGRIVCIHRLDRRSADAVKECLGQFLGELYVKQKGSLLMWLSQVYRNNAVHRLVDNRDWRLAQVDIGRIVLSRINPPVDAVLSRPKIDWRLDSFIRYLRCYFGQYPCSDPESLEEFRCRARVDFKRLIAAKRGRDVLVIDGAHRAVSMGLQGAVSFEVYVTTRL